VSEVEEIRGIFREAFQLAETRREVWLRRLNQAITKAGGARQLAAQDAGLAETYWRMLTLLADEWMKAHNPFDLSEDADAFSEGLITLNGFFEALQHRYTQKTAHKHLIELKHLGLIEQRGRGAASTLHLHGQALIAVRDTVLEWVDTHEALGRRLAGRR